MTFDEIEQKALQLLQTILSTGHIDVVKPPVPIEEIAERFLGLQIVREVSSNQRISGMIELSQKRISVNKKEPILRRRFSIAHEIGHWILHAEHHNGQVVFRTRKSLDRLETEANAFAGSLLMPSRHIYKSLLKNLATVRNFEVDWLNKIVDLIPSSQYKILNKLLFSQFFQMKNSSSKKKKDWADILISLIPRMAKEFEVSKEALSVRMQILGLLNPIYRD